MNYWIEHDKRTRRQRREQAALSGFLLVFLAVTTTLAIVGSIINH